MKIQIAITDEAKTYYPQNMPEYATLGSAGFDIRAVDFGNPDDPFDGILFPTKRILIKTGLFMAIPQNYALLLMPRSGLALKYGISLVNSPALIDSDYRGEIGVILENRGTEEFQINIGDRVAQGVFMPVVQAEFCVVSLLDKTDRGSGGFGSTGVW